MKPKKKTSKLLAAKARKTLMQKYLESILEPAQRLAESIVAMQKQKITT